MRSARRKAIPLLLALIVIVGAIPGGMLGYGKAFAANEFTGDGTSSNPYLIHTGSQLNKIRGEYLDASLYFKLTANIDLSGFAGGTGWVPIGTWDHPFIGHLDGNGYKISGLKIADSSRDYAGLFGYVGGGGYIANVKMEKANIDGGNWLGSLVAMNDGGTIENSSASGSLTGTKGVGGLVGSNRGILRNSYAAGSVNGSESAGGLAGINGGTILDSAATVDVSGSLHAGGLVGWQSQDGATISNSHADGRVSGSENVGGLVGWNYKGVIADVSSAAGTVSGIDAMKYVGGLVGYNEYGSISDSNASGSVTGKIEVGGLIGYDYRGNISNDYASGTVTGLSGSTNIGGLVGDTDYGTITRSYASGKVKGSADTPYAGGLIGYSLAATVSDSYATGDVAGYSAGGLLGSSDNGEVHSSYATGNVIGTVTVGGLVGWNVMGPISDSYAAGKANGTKNVGGLVGWNVNGPISNSYAIGKVSAASDVGGLVGFSYANTVVNSFYDFAATGQSASIGGVGKPTSEMRQQSTFEADQANRWDFANRWAIDPDRNGGYPYLREIQVYLDYDGNGHDGGTVPSSSSYMPGSIVRIGTGTQLTKAGYASDGWNTKSDGTGTKYRPGDPYPISATTTLFANWVLPGPTAAITSTMGTVSTGGTANETISDIPIGTTVAALKAAITPTAGAAFEIYESDGTTVAATLATGHKLIVTASDGSARTTYTVTVRKPSSEATLTSALGTVSAGGTANETLADIPYGTSLVTLIQAITPAAGASFDVYDADEATLATNLTRGSKVIVTAEDGATKVVYALRFVANTAATLTSTLGTVSAGGTANETFVVPYATTLTALKAAVTPADGATFEVYDADGATVATTLATGHKVIVTSEDGSHKVTYTVTIAPNTDATVTSAIGIVSTGGTATETITRVPFGTTLAAFKAAITPAAGATFQIYNSNETTVSTSLASGRKVIVIAQDGVTRVVYRVYVDPNADATITSSVGTVSAGGTANESITVPYGTTLTALNNAIRPAPGAGYVIYDADGTTVATTLATGSKVIVTAQDMGTKVTYTVTIATNSAKAITSFRLAEQTANAVINAGAHTVSIRVANGTNLNGLVATFALSPGASATVGSVVQESGRTANDFTGAVTYVVKAEDNSVQNWTVTVTAAASSAKEIASFSFAEQTRAATINTSDRTVSIEVQNGTSLNGLVASFTLSAGASAKVGGAAQISGTTANNFAGAVYYTVTAADNSTQTWRITVTVAANSAATLTSAIGTVSVGGTPNETIANIPYGTSLAALKAAITPATGATFDVYEADGATVAADLASGYKVIVTAQDGTTNVTYTITVNAAPPSGAATLTSALGIVSVGGTVYETIANIPYGTSLASLKAAIVPAAGATFDVYEADGATVAADLATGYKVIVTAQDGTTKVTYTITVNAAPPSGAATLTSTIGTVSVGGTPNETITNIPYGTSLASLKAAIVPAAGATFDVYTADGITVAADLATGYKVIVTAQDGTTKATYTITVNAAPPTSGGPSVPDYPKVVSTNGRLHLRVGEEGEVSLEQEIIVSIPANATDKELRITIEKIANTGSLLAKDDVLATAIFEILKNSPDFFAKQVTLTFKFDPASLKSYQRAAIFYYDEEKKSWVEIIGSKVNGRYISVTVNHFTKFAVFAVGQAPDQPTDTDPAFKLNDIAGHWAEPAILQAASRGIVTGYPDGTFKPNHIVTRAEFTVMLVKLLKPQGSDAALTFSDASKIGAWAKSAVAQAVLAGYIKGYEDGTFRPDEAITRAEMTVMIKNALQMSADSSEATGFADEKSIPSWAKEAVTALRKLGYIQGNESNQFHPNDKTTRAEAVSVLLRLSPQ
ncbi:S-layer homology domain-containing protein [Cohnella nanjingensis]|uniref:S-layer homology domain-containing protein n=1 Tax=Cohnella nanjingensis TaxID=1387779 RepID=A0A7X0VHR2_9BACL|nr:S-layer homology domain-containing protein [Cohnella nanjingensis]MBB6672924.1 S-layer homology domain-containing protein [Cohnella nanjingensis]